jgi:signal transduction histidine kinase
MTQKDKPINNQNLDSETKPEQASTGNSVDLHFPWLSTLVSLLIIGFLVISSQPELINFYSIPEILLTEPALIGIVIFSGIIYAIDIRLFLRKKRTYQQRIENLQQQLDTVWESKKKQQQRANIYSGHADKLKYFISEKLLETIEYDEKYLHFKGIAAEVRHNGVISYDKILTALTKAIDQHHQLEALNHDSSSSENTENPNKQSLRILSSYETAVDSIRYLWDLLDLSTAENMGLHIGNQLIECEENYYQLNLDSNKQFEVTQSIPLLPTFHPQIASLMTLAILLDEAEINTTISLAKIDDAILEETFVFENEQFKIELFATPVLLGNPNHVILLLENLIKNAQFFIQKNRYKQNSDRICIRLFPGDGYAQFEIFNRGPLIKPDEIEKIFKLGYSSRRSKQHHGKGLGLFFASEIVKGYNGQIQVDNIENVAANYTIKLHLRNGDTQSSNFSSQWIDGRMKVVDEGNSSWQKELGITTEKPIESIEIASDSDSESLFNEDINKDTSFEWFDPSFDYQPKWVIQIKPFKKQHKLIFKPLDISGVCFNIKLPTADSRLNQQQLDFEQQPE